MYIETSDGGSIPDTMSKFTLDAGIKGFSTVRCLGDGVDDVFVERVGYCEG